MDNSLPFSPGGTIGVPAVLRHAHIADFSFFSPGSPGHVVFTNHTGDVIVCALSIAESVVRRITFNAQRITKEPKISWRIMRKRSTVEITMPCAGYTLPEINT